MLKFEFSMYGLGAMICLFLISFIWNWVLKVNFKNRYRTFKLKQTAPAIKIAKSYLDLNHQKAHFQVANHNFWTSNFQAKTITLEEPDFYGHSLYALQDALFKAVLLTQSKNQVLQRQLAIKLCLFVVMNLLVISAVMSFLVGVFISLVLFLSLFGFEYLATFKYLKKINKQTIWLLQKHGIAKKIALKSFRINQFYIFDKYISIFSESWISGFVWFKNWGNSE